MKIIAHRGARGYEPENTLLAFKKALEIGVDAIELDVFVLRGGEVVVLHDVMVDRTTNGTGHIEDFNFTELRQLNAGAEQSIPTLQEVIELVDRSVPIFIELKSPKAGQAVARIVNDYLSKGWQPEDFEIVSFNHPELIAFKQACSSVRTGGSIAHVPIDNAAYAKQLGVDSIMISAEFMTPELITDAHERGLIVNVYTGEDSTSDAPKLLAQLQALGVDGWVSDRPDVAKSHLGIAA